MNRYTSILLLAVALISVSCATAEKPWWSKGEEGNKSAASKPSINHRISPKVNMQKVNMHLSYDPKPIQTSRRLPEDNKEEEKKKEDEKKDKGKVEEENSANGLEENAAFSSYRVRTATAFALAATSAMIF